MTKKIVIIVIIIIILVIGVILWYSLRKEARPTPILDQQEVLDLDSGGLPDIKERIEINLEKQEFTPEEIQQIQKAIPDLVQDIQEQLQSASPEDVPAKLRELNILTVKSQTKDTIQGAEPEEIQDGEQIEINLEKQEFTAEEIQQIQSAIPDLVQDIQVQLQSASPEDLPTKLRELNILTIETQTISQTGDTVQKTEPEETQDTTDQPPPIQEERIEINLEKQEFTPEEIQQIQDAIPDFPPDIQQQLQGVSPEDVPKKLKELNIIKIVR